MSEEEKKQEILWEKILEAVLSLVGFIKEDEEQSCEVLKEKSVVELTNLLLHIQLLAQTDEVVFGAKKSSPIYLDYQEMEGEDGSAIWYGALPDGREFIVVNLFSFFRAHAGLRECPLESALVEAAMFVRRRYHFAHPDIIFLTAENMDEIAIHLGPECMMSLLPFCYIGQKSYEIAAGKVAWEQDLELLAAAAVGLHQDEAVQTRSINRKLREILTFNAARYLRVH